MKPDFAVSLMCMDYLKISEQMEVLNDNVSMLHADIMDGHFCKNITLSPDLIKAFASVTTLPIDAHLMTTNPGDWIDACAEAGAGYISLHAETINTDAFRQINYIKSLGCKVGIVLNPATPLEYIRHYLNRVDMLTIMTVDVGFAGQSFIDEMLEKIEEAVRIREENGYTYKIQVDGSVNERTYKRLYDAGCDVYVLGSSGLFTLDDDLQVACDKAYEIFERETNNL